MKKIKTCELPGCNNPVRNKNAKTCCVEHGKQLKSLHLSGARGPRKHLFHHMPVVRQEV